MDTVEMPNITMNRASELGIPVNNTLIKLMTAFHQEGIDEGKKLARVIRDTDRFLGYGGQTGKTIKEYLTTEDLEGTDLVVEEVASTISNAAQFANVLRGIFPEQPTKSNSFRWPKGEEGLGAMQEVDEAGEIPDEKEDFGKTTFTILKYGSKARITGEMLEDGLFNLIEREIANLGTRAANTYTDRMLQILIDGAGAEHDAAGSNLDDASLLATKGKLRGDQTRPSYLATHAIVHPEFMTKLEADTDVTSIMARDSIMSRDRFTRLHGQQIIEVDNIFTSAAARVWGWGSGDEIGILVVNAPSAAGFAINRELRLDNFKDPIRDLVGVTGTIRFAAGLLHSNAVARGRY